MSFITKPPDAIPGPPAAPLLGLRGNILAYARDPSGYLQRLHQEYGDIAAVARGSTRYVFVFTPELNEHVLADAKRFHVVEVPFPIPADGALARLFTIPGQMNGARNRRQRQILHSALNRNYYANYRERLVTLTGRMLDEWRVGQQRDLFREMVQLTTASPCYAMFGLDPDGDGRTIVDLLHQWGEMLLAFSTRLLPFDLPGSAYRRLLRSSERLEQQYLHLIQARRARGLSADDPLDMLIHLRDTDPASLSQEELTGLVNNLFNGGNSSKATVLTWTLFLLGQHPRALASVRQELDQQLAGRPPALDQLPALRWLEAALNESMRLLPPMNWLSRRVMAPVQLDAYPIPPGSMVMVSPLTTHRRPDLYPRPNQFRPERWLQLKPGPYDYLPWGAGPRMCTGKGLAMLEMRIILTLILQRYQLASPSPVRIDRAGLMLSAPKQMPVVIRPAEAQVRPAEIRGNITQLVEFNQGG